MADLFLFGTLRHVPLLEVVLGRAEFDVEPARLDDHAVRCVKGHSYPMLLAEGGSAVDGLVLLGLNDSDLALIDFYEARFGYARSDVVVTVGDRELRVDVYVAPEGKLEPGKPWSLEDWVEARGDVTVLAAEEVMAWHGRLSAAELAERMVPIERRAAARIAARTRAVDEDRDVTRDVEVERYQHAYMDFFAMDEIWCRFRRHDGEMSETMKRAGIMVGDAAVVLPYDPKRDEVLLVEQFRAPLFMAGDTQPWLWEPPAGLIDPGETPEGAAHREVEEEAGITLDRLEYVARAYPSSGNSGEFLHLFVGLADFSQKANGGGGLDSEGEDIRSQRMSFDALMERVDACTWRDMPLVTIALWLARHRDRLRGGGA